MPSATAETAGLPGDLPEDVRRDLARLEEILAAYGPTLVAFSGGVDSTLVAAAAARALGEEALAVTGVSGSLAASEREAAGALTERLGIRHRYLETYEMQDPDYRANAGDRCYFCKSELFDRLVTLAEAEGFAAIATGDNLDDLGGHRPGMQAAAERRVRHPLIEASLGKEQIRALARALGLPNHAKPAAPCLASRVPAGTPVSPEVLARVEAAEAGVRALGFPVLRVRHHDQVARVELPSEDLPRALELRRELGVACRAAGYTWVTLDLDGFRSGSLHEGPSEPLELPEGEAP